MITDWEFINTYGNPDSGLPYCQYDKYTWGTQELRILCLGLGDPRTPQLACLIVDHAKHCTRFCPQDELPDHITAGYSHALPMAACIADMVR